MDGISQVADSILVERFQCLGAIRILAGLVRLVAGDVLFTQEEQCIEAVGQMPEHPPVDPGRFVDPAILEVEAHHRLVGLRVARSERQTAFERLPRLFLDLLDFWTVIVAARASPQSPRLVGGKSRQPQPNQGSGQVALGGGEDRNRLQVGQVLPPIFLRVRIAIVILGEFAGDCLRDSSEDPAAVDRRSARGGPPGRRALCA